MSATDKRPLLSRIDNPSALRGLSADELQTLTDELRAYLIDTVSTMGGHFAAGLAREVGQKMFARTKC